jgi:post-segregation antitoxin (ccd killing protein)
MKSCEDQVMENITVSQQMARQIDGALAEKALAEKLYLSELAQKELQKELQKEASISIFQYVTY